MLSAESAVSGKTYPSLATPADDGDWLAALDDACLGAGLPLAAEQAIRDSGTAWHDEAMAEAHVLRAFELAPEHPATHIALYRFYFYRNRLAEAYEVGRRCLRYAAVLNGLPLEWRDVQPAQTDFSAYAALPRFYLFTLKGCAYLSLRLGQLAQGDAMVDKLLQLDPADRVNGSVLRGVLDRLGRDDDE